MNDIFTDMQARIGCPYLSDLPYYKRAVWFEMKRLCLSDYPKKQLEDFFTLCIRCALRRHTGSVTKKGRDETWKKCVYRLKPENQQTARYEPFGSPCLSTQNRWKNCWGIDVDTDYYSITGKELPFADEVQEDTTIERIDDLYHIYESLPSDLKEDYGGADVLFHRP